MAFVPGKRWRAALSNIKNAPARLAIYGASDELYFSPSLDLSWPGQLRNQLLAATGTRVWGDCYHARMNAIDCPFFAGALPIVARAGPIVTSAGYGTADAYVTLAVTLQTFTTLYPSQRIDWIYQDTLNKSQKSIDGGAFDNAGIVNGNSSMHKRFTQTNLNPAIAHSLATQQVTAAADCISYAFASYPLDPALQANAGLGGLAFSRFTVPGTGLFDYMRQDGTPPDKTVLLSDSTTQAVAPGFGWPMVNDLNIIVMDMMINDLALGNPIEYGLEALMRMCYGMRRAVPDTDFLFLLPSLPDGIHSDVLAANTIANIAALWPSARRVVRQAAGELGAFVVDLDTRWLNFGFTRQFQTNVNGGFHMNYPQGINDCLAALNETGLFPQ